MTSRCHVFVGPTLSPARVQALLPGAAIHPPVAHRALLSLDATRGDRVAIVDGVFHQSGSVRHKEILHLLEQGVDVWGAASMGALRAAELAPFGMRGTGLVFRLYHLGVLERDDEVAVTHADARAGYRQMSDALVTIRVAARRARRLGLIDRAVEQAIVSIGASTPYGQRLVAVIARDAQRAGAEPSQCARFSAFASNPAHDVKRQDAEMLLKQLADRSGVGAGLTPHCPPTVHLEQWRWECKGELVGDRFVCDEHVLTLVQACAEWYPAFHRALVLEAITDGSGRPDPLEAARERGILTGAGLSPNPRFAAWLTEDELALDVVEACTRLLVRSFRWHPGMPAHGMAVERLRQTTAFRNAQVAVADALAFNDELTAADPRHSPERVSDQKVMATAAALWGVEPGPGGLERAAQDRGFASRHDLVRRLRPLVPSIALRGRPTLRVSPS